MNYDIEANQLLSIGAHIQWFYKIRVVQLQGLRDYAINSKTRA